MNTIEIAKKYINEYNLNVLPTNPKEKSPAGSWKEYINRKITEEEIERKFQNADLESIKMGIICGKISGDLEVLDFDNKLGNAAEIFEEFKKSSGVNNIIVNCPIEETQSGGFHIYYRSDNVQGNQKLASDKALDSDKYECLIESRGEGGFIVCAPSKGYQLIQGDFSNIHNLTPDERDTLLSAARNFDKKTLPEKVLFKNDKIYSEKPWTLYDESDEGLCEAKELLKEQGWMLSEIKNGQEYWIRPGKSAGVSATFKDNCFYVFSSSASPFENNWCYKPSSIYAILKFGNDFKKAVKSLVGRGYGSKISNAKSTDISIVENFLDGIYNFRINEVTGRLEMKLRSEINFYDTDDYHLTSIHRRLQHEGIDFSYEKLNHLLTSDFVPKYNPFIDYFHNLPEWNGEDSIEQLSKTLVLADENQRDYWYRSLRKYLIALVACATIPEITNEVSIIFYGKQGEGKTKWLNHLLPMKLDKKYLYVGTINDDKDSKLNLSSKLLINLDELGSLNREEIGFLKSLFSIDTISLREPYMRKSKVYVRRASFVGSIDREEFLSDLAGTRRFLSFSVKTVDYNHSVEMDKVYSQAYHLLKQGERFYFDRTDIEEVEKNNEDFRIKTFEEGLLFELFCIPKTSAKELAMTSTEIAQEFAAHSSSYKLTDASIRKIGQLLKKHNFIKKNVKKNGISIKYWIVERRPSQPLYSGVYNRQQVVGGN